MQRSVNCMAIAVVYLIDYKVLSGVDGNMGSWIADHECVWMDTFLYL